MTDVTAITIPQLTGEMVARAGFKSEKDFLIKAQADSDLDAYEAFLECEEEASGKLKASKRVFTEAVLKLNEIRERSLWVFSGQPSWTAYLGAWCDNEGAKPSTAFKFLALVKIWQGGLGKPAKELTEYADGVYTVLPLLDKSKGKPPLISGYDPETGEIQSVSQEWAPLLPDGDTPQERVRAYVRGEFQKDDTLHILRQRMRQQVQGEKEKRANGGQTDHGRLAIRLLVEYVDGEKKLRDITWELWQNGKKACDGIGIAQLNKNERARELFSQALGHQWQP